MILIERFHRRKTTNLIRLCRNFIAIDWFNFLRRKSFEANHVHTYNKPHNNDNNKADQNENMLDESIEIDCI